MATWNKKLSKTQKLALQIILVIALLFFLSIFRSKRPDGLEKVAQDKGFADKKK